MADGAWKMMRRGAVSAESSFYTSGGSWTQLRGVQDLQVQINQEVLPDERHTTARKSNYAPHLGVKTAQATFFIPWHDDMATDLAPLFLSAFGFKSSDSLTYNDSGSTDGIIVKSDGTHDPQILITTGGVIYARPVKSVSSNDGTLGIKLPGAGDPTAATNADATNGGLWYYDPTAATTSVQMEVDRAGEDGSLGYILKGGTVTSMSLELNLSGRMGFQFTVTFYDWTQDTTSNISNPSAVSGHFLGMSGEAYLQDWGTPDAGTQRDVSALSVDLTCERITREAMRAPGGTVPGNPAVGVYSARFAVGGVRIVYSKIAVGNITDFNARTAKGGMFAWYKGRPGASTTKDVVSLALPRLIPASMPQEVEVGDLVGHECTYTIEEDTALTAPYGLPSLLVGSAA